MDDPPVPDDVLVPPTRARLLSALAGLRRPATTAELAERVGRHPNTVRVALRRMERSGLVECRRLPQRRGRPRHVWAIRPGARPGGVAPEAHGDLSRWLARAMRRGSRIADVEAAGREIGHELAPDRASAAGTDAVQDALAALGFAPRAEAMPAGGVRYVLANCPYRRAVAENAAVVCSLHRGITQGLLDRLQPDRRLSAFVARDPFTAGCLIEHTAA
jgi:predicted ArsR family transcriptional regulator